MTETVVGRGERDLDRLLAGMAASLDPETYCFVTLDRGAGAPQGSSPRMGFLEEEGLTLVLTQADCRSAGLVGTYPCRMITLTIHSALEAVGFLAAVTGALAAAGISCNPVSAFHHDHLFVPENRADEAMLVLADLAARAGLSAS